MIKRGHSWLWASLLAPLVALAEPVDVKVESQPLGGALNVLAEQLGVQLVYDGALVTGLKAPLLSGRMEAREALQRILAGSGLTFRFTSATAVTLERDKNSATRTLGPVRIEGAESGTVLNGVNGSRDVTATEGSGSYTSGALTIGSKTPQSIKDTPQSVSVLTAQRMEEQNVTDLTEAMKQSTGVTLVQDDTNLQSTFYSRGFEITSVQIDGGAPLRTVYSVGETGYALQIDTAQYDHVEILRGAAGLVNGYGNPGGTVNLVRKRPLSQPQLSVEAQLGSWNMQRIVLDGSSPLGFDGKLRGRAVVSYQDQDYFYRFASNNRTMAYGIVEYDVTPSTLLTAGVSTTRQDSVPWYRGLPRYQDGGDLRLPRDTALVFPWNRWDFDSDEIFTSVQQAFGKDWMLDLKLTYAAQESSRKIGYSTGTINPLTGAGASLGAIQNDFASGQLLAQLTLSGSFEVLGQRQQVTMGLSRIDNHGGKQGNYISPVEDPYVPYPGGPAGIPSIDVFNFNPYDPAFTEPRGGLQEARYLERGDVETGAYINLTLTAFDRVHLVTGVRYSRFDQRTKSESLCTQVMYGDCAGQTVGFVYQRQDGGYKGEDFSWPPNVSMIYDLHDNLSVYAGYTDIYSSQASYLDADLEPMAPLTGANMEVGLKWQSDDRAVNASIAGYRIEQRGFVTVDSSKQLFTPEGMFYVDNRGNRYLYGQMPDGEHYCCYIEEPSRTQVSRGVDLELAGELLPAWQVSLGYTWSENEQKGSYYGAKEGQPFVSRQPEHLLKLWTSHALGGRLMVGGGVTAQSKAYIAGNACVQLNPPDASGFSTCARSMPYDYTQEAYAIWSARVDYAVNKTWSVALNAENLADQRYYQTMGANNAGNWYGEPRNYMLTAKGRF